MNRFDNVATETLIADIERLMNAAHASFQDVCVYLLELKKRGTKHPLHKHKVYQHFEAVARETVIPEIIHLFNGSKAHIACFVGKPHKAQKQVAAQRDMDFAILVKGEIAEVRKPAARMSLDAIRRAFPPGESYVRAGHEQRAILEAELAGKPETHKHGKPLVRAVPDRSALTVAGKEIPLTVFAAAFAEMGLRLVPVAEQAEAA